jgi:hypothetical protein
MSEGELRAVSGRADLYIRYGITRNTTLIRSDRTRPATVDRSLCLSFTVVAADDHHKNVSKDISHDCHRSEASGLDSLKTGMVGSNPTRTCAVLGRSPELSRSLALGVLPNVIISEIFLNENTPYCLIRKRYSTLSRTCNNGITIVIAGVDVFPEIHNG